MRRSFHLFLIIAATLLIAGSCSEERSPLEAGKEETVTEPAFYGPVLSAGPAIFSDDFEDGLDNSVWWVEHVGNVEWIPYTDGTDNFIRSPGQMPYAWGNRITDIITYKDDFTDFELSFDARIHTESWHKDGRWIYLRCTDNFIYINGYHVYFASLIPTYTPHRRFHIAKLYPDLTAAPLSENVPYPWMLGQWYSFRIYACGNEFKAKAWPREDPEPEEWILETVDEESSYMSGRIGFGDYWGSVTDVDNVVVSSLIKTVELDIKPGSCPNPFNPGSSNNGVLPVAVLGSADFDVTEIDPLTVTLGGVAPTRFSYEDVAEPYDGSAYCGCTEDGPDGFTDMSLKFPHEEIASVIGNANKGDYVTLEICGQLTDGTGFKGVDCVKIVGSWDKKQIKK